MKTALKGRLFRLLGKDPEAVVISFATGDAALTERMFEEVRTLLPDRQHILVAPETLEPGSAFRLWRQLRARFARQRVGLAPVLFDRTPAYRSLRIAAFLLAPQKILAYNRRLERHHLRVTTWIASLLFLRDVPLDRIFLRPRWWAPWSKRERSSFPRSIEEIEGRPLAQRPRVAVLTPYLPYPLSHGGAVRIFNLLREMSQHSDVFLFGFRDRETAEDLQPLLTMCARLVLVRRARYREPRWSTFLPPEVHEFRSPALASAITRVRRQFEIPVLQVEYTSLAPYAGDILVEHDVTFALYRQIQEREPSLSHRWDYWRWRRFEQKWVRKYASVVAMSKQDSALLGGANLSVIPNGVDLDRFRPQPEFRGENILFVGSFRHFPNIVAFRFFWDKVWPQLEAQLPGAFLTVIAGPDPELYWSQFTGLVDLPSAAHLRILGFTADVRPHYEDANLVVVPTLESAGTNLKVLEAMAMQRAVLSTTTGCQGFGLEHGVNVWIADDAHGFAQGAEHLLRDHTLRRMLASAGRAHVEQHFGWKAIGDLQQKVLARFLPSQTNLAGNVLLRPLIPADVPQVVRIEKSAFHSSQWHADDFLAFDCQVAILNGEVAGFLVSRQLVPGEREILNVAVDPASRRGGIATLMIQAELTRWPGTHFLEVRESNHGARTLYERIGFQQAGTRPAYYDDPVETGIVMRIFS